jgi:hypothetical protein
MFAYLMTAMMPMETTMRQEVLELDTVTDMLNENTFYANN